MTGKSLGFKKGDVVFTGAFPGVIISDVHTSTPVCEVWGFEHESGSVYAQELKRIDGDQFVRAAQELGHSTPIRPYSDVARAGLVAAGVPVA